MKDYELTEVEERVITRLIAATFGFEMRGRGAVCKTCGIRFQSYAIGRGFNERMIQHAERHGIGYGAKENQEK